MDIKTNVRAANIVYTRDFYQTGIAHVPLYLANGWIGGGFDEFGLQSRPSYDMDQGRTQFSYVNHCVRRKNNGHDQFPLFYMTALNGHGRPPGLAHLREYHQELDLFDMTLTTRWRTAKSGFELSAFASMAVPQLFELSIDSDSADTDECLTLMLTFDTAAADNNSRSSYFAQTLGLAESPALSIQHSGAVCKVQSLTNAASTEFLIAAVGAKVCVDGATVRIALPQGRAIVRVLVLDRFLDPAISVHAADYVSAHTEQYRHEHIGAANRFWTESGNLFLPPGSARDIWLRSKYYLASAVPPLPTHLMEPTGLNNNIWGHGFPQDGYYVVENLPRLGLTKRALAQMPYWLDNLEAVGRYTRRIAQREGAFYPWIPPFFDWDQFEIDGPTNEDAYEFHNSGYVAAMVWNYWQVSGDRDFLQTHAPIIQEVARFYVAITELADQSKARIVHPHIRSQDEAMVAGAVTINPLCAIYSALYTFRAFLGIRDTGIAVDSRLAKQISAILERGYDLDCLLRPDSTLKTSATDERPLGRQKHPVQLNAIALLPLPDLMDWEPVVRSWQQRYDLTLEADVPVSYGWTLGLFALASARMRSGAQLARDLSMIQPARFADPLYIQFYESSCRNGWSHKKSYYFTTHGLYLQGLTDAVVQYCRGTIDLFAALLPQWERERIEFAGLKTNGGLSVSGWWDNGSFEVELMPSADLEMPVRVSRPVEDIEINDGTASVRANGNADLAWRFVAGRGVRLRYSA